MINHLDGVKGLVSLKPGLGANPFRSHSRLPNKPLFTFHSSPRRNISASVPACLLLPFPSQLLISFPSAASDPWLQRRRQPPQRPAWVVRREQPAAAGLHPLTCRGKKVILFSVPSAFTPTCRTEE